MFDTSARTLELLAALVWYSGAVVLFIKSVSLLLEAYSIDPDQFWLLLVILLGLMIGVIKAKYLFKKLCIKNLKRIDALDKPKLWHFYRLRFFIFLFSMIVLGHVLTQYAHDNYPVLMTMAVVELSIATALLGSSRCFWKER